MQVYAGTSGFSYKEWKGKFYPENLAANKMLGFYSGRLPTVEINNTFYRMPKPELLNGWVEQVPEDFRFAIKASQRITHKRRLKEAEQEAGFLFETLAALGQHLGIVLFQLPPFLRADVDVLDNFLKLLPAEIPCAFEFRHRSWFDQTVYNTLEQHNKTLCIADSEKIGIPEIYATSDIGYVRLRRTEYTDRQLKDWAEELKKLKWKQLYVFFKHEDDCGGPELAASFLEYFN